MPLDPIAVSVVGGLVLTIVYILLAWYCKQAGDLQAAVIIAVSWSGCVAAFNLGWTAFFAPAESLGILQDERTTIMLGVGAMIWVSVASAYTQLRSPWVRKQQATDQPDNAAAE